MVTIFDRIDEHVKSIFGDGPVCIHLGDIEKCEIKRHPVLPELRKAAMPKGSGHAIGIRLWESLVAIGRVRELVGDSSGKMLIVSCLTPCLRSTAWRVVRDRRAEIDDVMSEMVEAMLRAWSESAKGVPPRSMRDRMMSAGFDAGYRYGKKFSPECPTEHIDFFAAEEDSGHISSLKASSIIEPGRVMDSATAEILRGEAVGARLSQFDTLERLKRFHDDIRACRRGAVGGPVLNEAELARSWISGANHYYYYSDLFPLYMDMCKAADVLGVSESTARRMARNGEFPYTWVGRRCVVPVKGFMMASKIPDPLVHADDVENGAAHALGFGGPSSF
ncbi:helix-turn-helix domain-containing protein [Streptacidiphilus fuscans]|uniref:Helix-turn-helix domain-containing protein n=1 Tax=Streptacidiphilus fuscans TaxID=2789292 RepID=A0A931B9E7_9ACTN|nr:helix-turn-helix domain-containing protein [Streptacidiphilus fuscans]MBF9071461.1 helix-turn-helix domain-containing protein [Streptacidiphilus fuscans]